MAVPSSAGLSAHAAAAPHLGGVLPVLALVFNAFTWGVSWWPFRQLEGMGLHPLWATALIYAVAVLFISLWRPASWGRLWRERTLWVLVLASGTTNAAFNWGVTIGDVVRVVLLFYLMPLWAVLLARMLLNERLTALASLRVAFALAGAAIVLWPAGGAPLEPPGPAEWLGIVGGFAFALNNVMLRRESRQPEMARALAMFVGGVAVSTVLAAALGLAGQVPLPPPPQWPWVGASLALAVLFLIGNLALQYGAARLAANVTAVVMVSEVLFASVSAVALGAGRITLPLLAGAVLIVAAALLSVLERR
jgi:drug/metabolite transporter (DMT)-like permease